MTGTLFDDPADEPTGPPVAVDAPGVDTPRVDAPGADVTAEAEPRPAYTGGPSWRPEVGAALVRAARRVGGARAATWVSLLVVAACSAFVFYSLHPDLILRNSTPTGGDMGAHVWGPMYLMHHVLPHGRLTGWTPDWYAGFPAFQFYMVLPALMVVALDVGVRSPLVVLAVPGALAVLAAGWVVPRLYRWRWAFTILGAVLTVLAVPIPYNMSFKLITVSGLVALPVAAWAFGRLAALPFPGPPILAVASLFFIYNREPTLNSGTGNIIGGNMASTMAGEFAFSISMVFCLLYLGFLVRGLRTGHNRAAAALTLALCGLSHLIPVFFALALTVVALVIWPGVSRLKWVWPPMVVAGLLSSFWVLPFLLRHAYVNDMGWEKLPGENATDASGHAQTVWSYLAPHALWWPLALALVGLIVSVVYRYRPGFLLSAGVAIGAAGFAWMPQARLWNARLLPFFYLSLFLLAGIGVSEVIRSVATLVARDPDRPGPWVGSAGAVACLGAALVFLGVPLGVMPGDKTTPSGGIEWLGMTRAYRNDVPGWAQWNYSGLEAKPVATTGGKVPEGQGGWPEFRDLIATMGEVGADPTHGCGRAFWEYGDRLETYGTPMAPMLLPYFTDSCIGSMEGLYFESSATTPYHFLSQCELSDKGSCAQRDLAYRGFDLDLGIKQLELLGVRYYLAFSDRAVQAADADPRLEPVAISGPWHVYQLRSDESALVTPLDRLPAVMTNVNHTQGSWLDPAVAWFQDPTRWSVPLATDGPADWPRVTLADDPIERPDGTKRAIGSRALPKVPEKAVTPAKVTDIQAGDDHISFTVDRVGSPVLVKASYFPNWEVSGAKGPYRVTPNLMVVVPTSKQVTLRYGRTSVDLGATAMSVVGLAGLVVLTRLPPVPMPEPRRRRRDRGGVLDEAVAGGSAPDGWWPDAPPQEGEPEQAEPEQAERGEGRLATDPGDQAMPAWDADPAAGDRSDAVEASPDPQGGPGSTAPGVAGQAGPYPSWPPAGEADDGRGPPVP